MKPGKNFILHGVLPAFLCLLCAIVTWAFVMGTVNPPVTEDVKEVKGITYTDTTAAAAFNFEVKFDAIRISGSRSDVVECITKGIALKVDVSAIVAMLGVPKEGTYVMPKNAVSCEVPDNLGNVDVEYVNMTVTLIKQDTGAR